MPLKPAAHPKPLLIKIERYFFLHLKSSNEEKRQKYSILAA